MGDSAVDFDDYAAFEEWYRKMRDALLEPARVTFLRLLGQHLDSTISDLDKHRIRVSTSRVKQPLRVWAKLQKPKYQARIATWDDIPDVLDDLVGLRIVCNNLSDIESLRGYLQELPPSDSEIAVGLALEPGSEKTYVQDPKASGYRAHHVNLVTAVPGLRGLTPVRGELQIRTLLQDGWGELTHEDTYKPGVALPPLVTTLSRRMADLLATVDDLAQDLRQELDRLAQSVVEDGPAGSSAADSQNEMIFAAPSDELPADLVLAETARIVAALTQPTTLATVANQLQATFGTGIRSGWAGYGSFKNLLKAAAPGIRIAPVGPSYIVPLGAVVADTWPQSLRDYVRAAAETGARGGAAVGSA